MLMPIYLSVEELREITGRIKPSAQIRWLRQQGFTVLVRANGRPLVSRAHFEVVMGGLRGQIEAPELEPDFGYFQ